jgi:hypothetical protein
MALTNLYEGTTTERDENGVSTTYTQTGTKAECEEWAAARVIGNTYDGYGKLSNVTVAQLGGDIYTVSARYQNANGSSGSSSTSVLPPDYRFGYYSRTMDGTMLSAPIEQHPSYLKNWNNYLLGRMAKVGGTTPSIPAWWSTAGATDVIPTADQQTYQWSDSGAPPLEDAYVWIVLKDPTKPGVTSYDKAAYTLTESARFKSENLASAAISAKLNKLFTSYAVGSTYPAKTGVTHPWKCDRGTVSWTGDYWIATVTYTFSYDGWDPDLYENYA